MSAKHIETEAQRRARYAAKDVKDKLGLKPAMAVRVVGQRERELLAKIRAKVARAFVSDDEQADVILYWPQSPYEVTDTLAKLKRAIKPAGGIWVVSFKKGRGTPYLPDAILIPLGLAAGLVDNKICSVSETQTAMRFVIRREDRNQ